MTGKRQDMPGLALQMQRRVAGLRNGLVRSMAPVPEAIFCVILSI